MAVGRTVRPPAWFRQISPGVGGGRGDALRKAIVRLNGGVLPVRGTSLREVGMRTVGGTWETAGRQGRSGRSVSDTGATMHMEAAYSAEILGTMLEAMGVLLPADEASWYDPGRSRHSTGLDPAVM